MYIVYLYIDTYMYLFKKMKLNIIYCKSRYFTYLTILDEQYINNYLYEIRIKYVFLRMPEINIYCKNAYRFVVNIIY